MSDGSLTIEMGLGDKAFEFMDLLEKVEELIPQEHQGVTDRMYQIFVEMLRD